MSTTDDNNEQYVGDSEEITSSKKECISCEQNNIDNITKGINSMAVLDDVSTCANCGKESNSDDMNNCNKCKMVKYCNAACKKKHRTKHKKKCDRRVAELHEEKLFQEVEPDECPICMLPLPIDASQMAFKSCCGKLICNGCMYAMRMSEGKDLCAFCRTPPALSSEENINQVKKLMDKGNADAFNMLAGCFTHGILGISQDWAKANDLFLKAGELGCSDGYLHLGISYRDGTGVAIDTKKAKHYFELAAMMGHILARYNLGLLESGSGNVHRAFKHIIISARAGHENAVKAIKIGFTNGYFTKDEYADILRAYQKAQDEMKSDERDKAASEMQIARLY